MAGSLSDASDRPTTAGRLWDAVIVGPTALTGRPAHTERHLARHLGMDRRVLFVDPPAFLHDVIARRAFGELGRRRTEPLPGVVEVRPLALPGADRDGAPAVLRRSIDAQVARAARREVRRPTVLIVSDPRRGALEAVPRDLLVYWQRDLLLADETSKHAGAVARGHEQLLEAADLVVGVTAGLAALAPASTPTLVVENGCEVDHFATPRPIAPELSRFARPIVGFLGGVSWRVDVELLVSLADSHPEWAVVLVGEVVVDVPSRPNLHLVGPRPYDELPAWTQGFDVGIVPYRVDAFNMASSPLKAYEYLASGAPVVSTPLPALAGLEPCVRVAEGQAFVDAVASAIADGPRGEPCLTLARTHDWHAQVERFVSVVDRLV